MTKYNLQKNTIAAETVGSAQWVNASDLAEQGLVISGSLVVARPVNTLIYNGGELFISTDASSPAYTQITNTGGLVSTGIVLANGTTGVQTFFATIADALAASAAGDEVLIYPGTYNEAVDFTLAPATVRVSGIGSPNSVVIAGPDATSPRVVAKTGCSIRGLRIQGPSGANDAVDLSGINGALHNFNITFVTFVGTGGTGAFIGAAGGPGTIAAFDCTVNGGAMGSFLRTGASSATYGIDRPVFGFGTLTDGIRVDGPARVVGQDVLVNGGSTIGDLFQIDAGGFIDITGVTIDGQASLDVGLHVVGDGVDVNFRAAELEGNVNDIVIDPALTGTGTEFLLNSCEFRQELLSIPPAFFQNASIEVIYFDTGVENDRSIRIGAELSVGAPFLGRESTFGEGDSSVNGMSVLSDDGTGTSFVDNTAAARSATGSTFSLFQSTGVGEVAYFGSLDAGLGGARQFPGISVDGNVAIVLGAGAIQSEYWNGAAWVDLTIMVTDAEAPYGRKAQRAFQATTTDQIRWDVPADWEQTTVDGRQGFWIRWRITSAITTGPVLERVKLGTNRTEINADGVMEFFGAAITYNEKPLPQVSINNTAEISGITPGRATINYSANVDPRPLRNVFANSVVDALGQQVSLPDSLDTSRPLRLRVLFQPSNANAGNVELRVRAVRSQVGDVLNGTLPEVVTNDIVAVGGTTDQVYEANILIDVSDYESGDALTFSLERDGNASNPNDSYNGNVELSFLELIGFQWR